MPGVGDPKVIDLVTSRPGTGELILVMSELRDGGPEGALVPELQEKFLTYLDFVEHGFLAKKYPKLAGKPVRIRLDSRHARGKLEMDFLAAAKSQWLESLGISLELGRI